MNPFDQGYFTDLDLKDAGFKSIGKNVKIARNCTIIGLENIEIGDNVRIDGYCTIIAADAGWLKLGSYIHIGSYCFLSAGDGIHLHDFCGLSQSVRIYSRTDDYSGKHLTNPTVPEKYTGVTKGEVTLGRHVIVGSGSVIFPGISIADGSAVGAQSLVTKSLDGWGVYFGAPVKYLKRRSKHLIELEQELISEET